MAAMPAVLSHSIQLNKQMTVADAEVIRLTRSPFLTEFDPYRVETALQAARPLCVKGEHAE